MALFRTVGPSAEPVTLAEVKSHLRLGQSSEDELIGALIRAAREDVERTSGMALIDQTWRLTRDDWPKRGCAVLPRHPVKAVLSVTSYDGEGQAHTLDPGDYQVDILSRPARIHFERIGDPLRALNGIEIDFTAGFGEAGTDVPDLLRRAIIVLVAHWFEMRGEISVEQHPASYPPGYERMLQHFRERRL